MEIIKLEETPSTNQWLRERPDMPAGTVVSAFAQTAGRGQRGNSWESAPGENLTFSILVRPTAIPVGRQFAISRAVALAIAEVLDKYLKDVAVISVKWPNDIYADDRKICGILIENTLSGNMIERSVIGVGINVNQSVFMSDAPNPVSMAMIAGRKFDLDELLERFAKAILRLVEAENDHCGGLTGERYFARLWRSQGCFKWHCGGEVFEARIAGVDDMGFLTLERTDGRLLKFAFKEVAPVLSGLRMKC